MLKRLYDRLTANQYLYHNLLLFSINILTGVCAYLLHPFLGQMLGIQQYGRVAALIAFSLVLITPTQIIATVATKYASASSVNGNYARLNSFIRRLSAILLALGIGITVVFAALSSYTSLFFHLDSSVEVILLGLTFITAFVTPLNLGILQGLQRFGWYATVTFLSAFLRLALSIGLVFVGLGVNGALLGLVLSALLAYLVSFRPLREILRGSQAATGSLRSLWSYSVLAGFAAAGTIVLYSIDTVLARHFLSDNDAGLYAALATTSKIILYATSSVSLVMFPRVAALHERGESQTRVVIQALLGVLLLATVLELAFAIAPLFIVQLLFGKAFTAIAEQLAPYGIAMLLLAIGGVIMNYYLAIGSRFFVLIIILTCILQAGLLVWHHANITQFVQATIVSSAVFAFALLLAFIVNAYKIPVPSVQHFRRRSNNPVREQKSE
ncbi:MAG: hypothetical protein PVS3B3_28860 [Ktedonobacteraceae bacterium]